jgi:hypothetical protein
MEQLTYSTKSHSSDCQFPFSFFSAPQLFNIVLVHNPILVCRFSHKDQSRISHCSSAWIAWFPVLFYSTLYVGDLYKRSLSTATTDEQQNLIDAEATRLGSRALFYSALVALTCNFILPAFVAAGHPPQTHVIGERLSWWRRVCHVPRGMQIHLVTMWAVSHLVFAGCMFATLYVPSSCPLFIVHWIFLFYSFTHCYGIFMGCPSMGTIFLG